MQSSNNAIKLNLKSHFYEARMTDKETLVNYIDRITNITDRLLEIGAETEEKEICYKILSSIPERYKPITLSCLMLPEDKLKVSQLRQNFALESKGKMNENRSKEVLNTSTKQKKFNPNKEKKCFKCGMKGHISPDCRSPHVEDR